MKLPDNWMLFKVIVLDKIKAYCHSGIWPFEFESFTAWLNNFDDVIEEYLALQLIDSLVVRSYGMGKASYARLLHGEMRQHLLQSGLIDSSLSISDWKKQLSKGGLNNIMRFSPVKKNNDEGESGSIIYRMLSAEIDTNRYSLSKATETPKVIILVDDLIGSGDQFKEFALEFKLAEKLKISKIMFCPLIAYDIGVSKIKALYPDLTIMPTELIFQKDALFYGEDDQNFRNDQVNTVKDVKVFFDKMHKKYAPKMDNWFGYYDMALPFAFEWGCPNHTPFIFWMNESKIKPSWQQLFSRRA